MVVIEGLLISLVALGAFLLLLRANIKNNMEIDGMSTVEEEFNDFTDEDLEEVVDTDAEIASFEEENLDDVLDTDLETPSFNDEGQQKYYQAVLENVVASTKQTGPKIDVNDVDNDSDMNKQKYPYEYTGDIDQIVDALNRWDLSLLKNVKRKENNTGLEFLKYVDQECFLDDEFVSDLCQVLRVDREKPVMLYRQLVDTEKRRFDDWDTQYVYHYRHVVLLPDGRFVYQNAPREYSEIYVD